MRSRPVKRDGKFEMIVVQQVVPGDILFMRGGDIVPADCYYLSGDPCPRGEAALTGEFPPAKVPHKGESGKPFTGRKMYSGSILKVGECEAVVSRTGVHTMNCLQSPYRARRHELTRRRCTGLPRTQQIRSPQKTLKVQVSEAFWGNGTP